jgi:hypothetical protein
MAMTDEEISESRMREINRLRGVVRGADKYFGELREVLKAADGMGKEEIVGAVAGILQGWDEW